MRSVLVLLLATAFHARVKCEDCSGFGYELLTTDIAQLNLKLQNLQMNNELFQKTLQQHWEQSEKLISILQAQLESKNVDLVQLQRQVLMLFEENVKNAERINNQNSTQNTLQNLFMTLETNLKQQLEQFEEKISTLQNVVESKDLAADAKWVSWSVGEPIPKHAVFAGCNWDIAPSYVGRTHHKGDDIVAKVMPTMRRAWFVYMGTEIQLNHSEVLTGSDFSWIWDSDENVPANAVPIGKHNSGETHYVGRAHYFVGQKSSLVPGTVSSRTGGLLIPHFGKEHKFTSYEVLVHD